MGTYLNKPPPIHAYYDPDGSLVTFTHPKSHNAKKEFVFVSTYDAKKFNPDDICYVISASWHSTWINYSVSKNISQSPGEIDNMSLLADPIDRRLRSDLKFKKHYRAINRVVWEFYFRIYGGGPVIYFKVPAGYAEHEYTQSTWIKRIRLDEIAMIISPSSSPQPVNIALTDNPMAMTNASLAVNLLANNLARQKSQQAAELQQQVGAQQAEALALQLARDQAKQRLLAEEQQLSQQQAESNANLAASLFSGGLSEKLQGQAKAAGEEQATANTQAAAALFNDASVKKHFKVALQSKDMNKAREFAASMLKNAWKGKLARRKAAALKAKKKQLMLEAMARKVQSCYRRRLAKRKTQQLKEKRQRVKEELAAVIVQSRYRINRARRKAAAMRDRRRRLLEEAAALRVQSRWRIRQANGKITRLRQERQDRLQLQQLQCQRQSQAMVKIAAIFLIFIARRKLRRLQASQQYIAVVVIKAAREINIGDQSSSDPYVMLNVNHSSSSPSSSSHDRNASHSRSISTSSTSTFPLLSKASSTLLKRGDSSSLTAGDQHEGHAPTGPTLCQYRTKHLNGTLNPVWNETAVAVKITPSTDKIVLTLCDKDTYHEDKFLGQVTLAIHAGNSSSGNSSGHGERLLRGQSVAFNRIPIDSLKEQVHDIQGKAIAFPRADSAGKGTIDFEVRLAPRDSSQSGWILKLASSQMAVVSFAKQSTFKPRFLLLLDGQLSYYDNEMTLEQPRDTVRCSEVGLLQYGPDSRHGPNTLQIKSKDGSKEWFLHWINGESEQVISDWLRKIEAACHPVTINNEPSKFNHHYGNGGGRLNSVGSTTSNPINQGGKAGGGGLGAGKAFRRVSSLMGGKK